MTEPITGTQYEITSGPYRAIITETGAGLRELTYEGRDLILSHPADTPAPAGFGQLLIPWPNRVDHGRYAYEGVEYQLDLSEPDKDCAIHGLARWAPWQLHWHGPDRLRLVHRLVGTPGYPFRLELTAEYVLDAVTGLTTRVKALNSGSLTAPYGHGVHPYLTVGAPLDECEVKLPADHYQPCTDRLLPDGPPVAVAGTPYDLLEPRLIGDLEIDNAYTGLRRDADGRAWSRLSGNGGAVSLWSDEAHPWLEVYTADNVPAEWRRMGIGIEPMTCPPDAFNSGVDLIELKPGTTTTGSWGIVAG